MKTIALNSATLIQQITSSAGVVAVRQVFFVLFVFFVVISDSMSYCCSVLCRQSRSPMRQARGLLTTECYNIVTLPNPVLGDNNDLATFNVAAHNTPFQTPHACFSTRRLSRSIKGLQKCHA